MQLRCPPFVKVFNVHVNGNLRKLIIFSVKANRRIKLDCSVFKVRGDTVI